MDLGAWGLKTTFGSLGPKRHIQAQVEVPGSNFRKQDLIFSRIMRKLHLNFETSKNLLAFGAWGLGTTFGRLGPRRRIQP